MGLLNAVYTVTSENFLYFEFQIAPFVGILKKLKIATHIATFVGISEKLLLFTESATFLGKSTNLLQVKLFNQLLRLLCYC